MNNQAFYIWLQQGQDLWDQIQNFTSNNKDTLTIIISFTTFIFGAGAIRSFLCSLVQQNRKRKLLPDTFPFEVIKPQSNALQILLGGNENDPLADYKIPYQHRVPGRNTEDELKQKLDQHRWLLILAPTGWGKTREAANLADRLNKEGWTILKLKRGEWLEAPPIFPEDKIGTDCKLLFFLDNLNNKMSGGRIEQSPKADDLLQPLNKPLQERLFNTLQAYEKLCRKEDIRIIATARNEKEREFPDEPSEWEKLEFDKYPLWKRFEIYNLPEPNEEAVIGVLKETIHQANIQANPDDYSRIAQRNDRTFRNIVENIRSTKNYDQFLTIDTFRPTLKGTWKERYQKIVKQYPVATYIYDAVDLLEQFDIQLYRFTVEATAKLLAGGNILQHLWYGWQIRIAMKFLIYSERILEPRDGQIEAKGRRIESGKYILQLSNLLVELERQYPTEMLSSIFNFGYELSQFGHKKEAINAYDAAINIKPDDYEAWYNKGNAFYDLGNYKEAIIAYDTSINIKPDDHEAWYNRGLTLSALGKKKEAIIAYDTSINIKPDYYEAWYNKACCYISLKNLDQAIYNLQQAINLNSEECRELTRTDSDFDNIRNDPRFQALLQE
ncbi:MAG: tetratricopeptide repeat protein [Dolichospermum sp.]